jgi:hypothetical protein
MSTGKTFALIFLLLLIGPAMFVVARGLSLARAFDRVQVGDSSETLRATMGAPGEETHTGLYLHGDTEYRYSVWPMPHVWVVSLKDGRVLEKQSRASR